jgi:hypothetical protein
MIDIVFPEHVDVMCYKFKVLTDDSRGGAEFSFATKEITIGTKGLKDNPEEVFMYICHELLEVCYEAMSLRYSDASVNGNWKFFMDHKEFENSTSLFSNLITKFMK